MFQELISHRDYVAEDGALDAEDCQIQESNEHLRPESSSSSRDHGTGNCKACLKQTSQKCDLCQNEWICSRTCEREVKIDHIFRCSPNRPLDSADYLVKACYDGMSPDDSQTRDDFGFSKIYTRRGENRLWLLYARLIRSDLVNWDSRILHTWQMENRLASSIRLLRPTGSWDPLFSTSYSWFLENQHIVDASTPPLDDKAVVFNGFQWAWRHIGLEDASDETILDTVANWPTRKGSVFTLYTAILLGSVPGPQTEEWITFGFCACPNADSRAFLLSLYRILIDKCTFEEFCTATESSQLFRLLCQYIFEMKAPKRAPSIPAIFYLESALSGRRVYDPEYLKERIPYLQNVLEGTLTGLRSVWLLKQFALSDKCYPCYSVLTQYGFFNCQNAAERLELKMAYKNLLGHGGQGDPIKLQSACSVNKIYEYVSRVIVIDDKFKRLMRNLSKDGEEKYVVVRLTIPKKAVA